MIKKKIKLINKEALLQNKVSLYLYTENNNCILKVSLKQEEELKFISSDFFKTLCLFRNYIYDNQKLFPLCNGALKNVFPSSMIREMSNGMKAYFLTLGKQANRESIVDIFDNVPESEIENLTTVDEQLNYYKKWLKSL